MKNQQIVLVTAAVNCMDITMEINEDRTKRRKLTIENFEAKLFDSTEAEMLFKTYGRRTNLDAIDRRIDLGRSQEIRFYGKTWSWRQAYDEKTRPYRYVN
jgi:hypothetical protein